MPRVFTVDRRALEPVKPLPMEPQPEHDETEAKKIVSSVERWMDARRAAGWI
jgi:hypothetical protein